MRILKSFGERVSQVVGCGLGIHIHDQIIQVTTIQCAHLPNSCSNFISVGASEG